MNTPTERFIVWHDGEFCKVGDAHFFMHKDSMEFKVVDGYTNDSGKLVVPVHHKVLDKMQVA